LLLETDRDAAHVVDFALEGVWTSISVVLEVSGPTSKKLIDGDPLKPATKRLAGSWYTS